MTYEDFYAEQDEILAEYHPRLAYSIRAIAYDMAHSYGDDEVLCKVRQLAADLEEVNHILMSK